MKWLKINLAIMLALLVAIFSSLHLHADEQYLHKLISSSDAKAWQAVGLLVTGGGRGSCTGALIASNQVLTAAHCMYNDVTGKIYKEKEVKFFPGLRLGRAVAYRKARRIIVHKAYRNISQKTHLSTEQIAYDLALIELDHKVDASIAIPFDIYEQPKVGQNLFVVSYARGRNEAPSLEKNCKVLGHKPRILVADCLVDFGASGAPIFIMVNGQPRIASVVSAMAVLNGQRVSYGVALGAPLQELKKQLEFDSTVFQGKKLGQSLAKQLGRE